MRRSIVFAALLLFVVVVVRAGDTDFVPRRLPSTTTGRTPVHAKGNTDSGGTTVTPGNGTKDGGGTTITPGNGTENRVTILPGLPASTVAKAIDLRGILKLLAAFGFAVFAVVLLLESYGFQAWAAAKGHAPPAVAGIGLGMAYSGSIVIAWSAFVIAHHYPTSLSLVMVAYAGEFAPGLLIGAALLAAIAGVKFLLAAALMSAHSNPDAPRGGRSASLIGACLAVLHLSASIATLYMFAKSLL